MVKKLSQEREAFMQQTLELNKKTCKNVIRGCRSQLEINYKFSACQDCLEKCREQEKQKRLKIKEEQEKQNNEENKKIEKEEIKTKKCTACFQVYPLTDYVGKIGETKTCAKCRENNKIQDAKRDKEHMNELARVNTQKPERKEVKQEWINNNHDKTTTYWMEYRQRKIETSGTEHYQKQNAEQAKKWRENNPAKVKEINQNKNNNILWHYKSYKNDANKKNIEFNLTEEQFVELCKMPCYYCDVIQDKEFNGLDKKITTNGYNVDNCVSCCRMCNFMKGGVSDVVFINRMEHILTNKKLVNGQLYPECFTNHYGLRYSDYKYRALNKKNIEFIITNEDYENIVQQECYLCGKETDMNHQNGIDRVNNTRGYILGNIQPCCGECNYMKKEFELNEFLEKAKMIYNKHRNGKENTLNDTEHNQKYNKTIVFIENKKSKEELNTIIKQRKETQQKNLLEKYSKENIVERVQQLVKKKNENKSSENLESLI